MLLKKVINPCHVLNFLTFETLCSYMVCSYDKRCVQAIGYFNRQANFCKFPTVLSFLALQSTIRLLNRYSQVLGCGLIQGALLTICSSRVEAYSRIYSIATYEQLFI